MNIMTRILVASMFTPCCLLAGASLAAAAQPVAGQPVISQPVTVTWTQIESNSAMIPALLKAPPVVAPFMPAPADIQISAYPGTPPAGSVRSAQALLPGPVSAAVQLSAPAPLAAGGALAPALGGGFLGLGDNGRSIPPDTMGAVGPRHVMTMINSQVRIQNRAGVIISTVSSSAFWAAAGLERPFDPHLVYDTLSNRWIATCDAAPKLAASKVFFAISKTSDPTGVWKFYSFVADAAGVNWADYPGFGVNSKWIAITNNMFPVAGGFGVGVKMWVIDKSTALAGGALTTTVFPTGFAGNGFTLKPAVTFDATEPNLYIVHNGISSGGGATDYFQLSRLTGTAAAPRWSNVPDAAGPFPGTGIVDAIQRYNSTQVNAAQLGSTRLISSNDPRVMNAVFRNGRLWFTHTGGFPNEPAVATRTDMFWYEVNPRLLNTTGKALIQSGTLFASKRVNAGLLFPTVAVNKYNDAAFGFTVVDPTIYATAWVAGRKSTDPAGASKSAFNLRTKAGLAPYFKTFGGSRNRWGDYSATMADPLNNGDFWTIQEYADRPAGGAARWGTWWARVKMGRGVVRNDFNGDGKADILFHQTSTGKNFMVLMNGKRVLSQGFVRHFAPSWTVAGSGDYNGDGKADILFHQASTGRNIMVLMNGKRVLSQGFVRRFAASWTVAASGDYNGDGKADMLFHQASTGRNIMVLMNGKRVLSQGFVRHFAPSWTVAGSGDYNGDGKADILFHQASTGRNIMVLMNGKRVLSQGFVRRFAASWTLVGSGDYNGDGKADMLFHQASTGRNIMVLMNGKRVLSQGFVRHFPPSWTVAGSDDYNGDGKSDILFHQASTGRNIMVLMNGKRVLSQGFVSKRGVSWRVVNVQ